MQHLTLFAGLFLPWICGYVCLGLASASFNQDLSAGRMARAGYGFFIGYAILFALITMNSALSGNVSYLVVMSALLLLTGAAGLWLYRSGQGKPGQQILNRPGSDWKKYGNSEKLLIAVLLGWICIHLFFAFIEVITTPVYPWDASLLWIYRAKAWFYSGDLIELVSKAGWGDPSGTTLYTVDARFYPRFASVIPFWAALSLGGWSESLVNLPAFLCGVAISLAFYGQSRDTGVSTLVSLILSYFLISTPLFGTHMALAGYADLWMAGFAGLGSLALIRGLAHYHKAQLALGLGLITFSLLVKNEGAVWLYSGLLLTFLVMVRPRISLLILAGITSITLVFARLGVSYIELPLLGGVGLIENELSIPLVGTFSLQLNDVWAIYASNFFSMGNWNLAWVLIFGTFLGAMFPPRTKSKAVTLLFILIIAATQLFIFAFTQLGVWAADATAINRLPLQVFPALLFTLVLAAQSIFQRLPDSDGPENE